jgi:hypothetical protein
LSTVMNTSVTSKRPTDASMYSKVKMLKDRMSKSTEDTTVPTKDGRFFILTRKTRLLRTDWMNSLVSTETDHSTWSRSFRMELIHSTEWWKCSVTLKCY